MVPKQLFKGVSIYSDAFILKASKDKLEAFIRPKDDSSSGMRDIDYKAMKDEVKAQGVVYGLLDKPIPKGDGSYSVARGRAVRNGENAKVKTYVKPAVVRAPKVKNPAKDKVDYRELGAIVNVPKGKLLLEKIPPTPGTPGKDIFDNNILPKAGKELNIKVGPGVVLSEDGTKVTSGVEGKFMLADGKASVLTEHSLSGDVDMSIGNIAFVGDKLSINGTVLPGFKVKCKREIYISKGVESSEITAGESLEIKGGVIGEDVVLKSWGNIKLDFIENVGRVEAKGDLTITDSSIQVKARVGGNLRAMEGKGAIIGGKYIVGGSIYVKELGSDAEVITEINVGINPELEDKKKKLDEEKKIWPEKMNEIIKNTTALKKMQKDMGGKLPEDKAAMLQNYNKMLPQVMEKVNNITVLEESVEAEMDQAVNECIYVYGTVYPGINVTIGGQTRILQSEEHAVVIHYDRENRQIHVRAMTSDEKQAAK